MPALRARVDVILVLEVEGQAVQHEFFTTLKDQLELSKRYPKIESMNGGEAAFRLVHLAAERVKAVPHGTTFDDFVDSCLDLQMEDAPPLARELGSQDS